MPNAFDGINALLYKTDDFGSIRNSERGIEVTENFSHTTIAIALLLTDKALNHRPLIINASPQFQKAVLQAAIRDNLSRAVDALQNEIFAQILSDDNKNIFKTREVYDIIQENYP